ncbi:Outer membrane lipoprotein-sorting protein-like protein [Alkaliphilus metalliredigens QYMF]|uniref:Outer membrane lipoprotein-sorting protein-like protein n=1 Tax=Alkaliphilus metalliredigens (strain QYMF) TaxID=293826 RepID=A6TVK9_ALKMQ|nr:outer membrane lipoprotein-sorting protein [Alkaliphilus metalliredigens]ABR50227.1 Outer membrane lipoprotein-sorting protein-like protein [Alkaliphilus metalliredigens QYMF]
MRLLKVVLMMLLVLNITACQQPTDEELFYKAQKKLGGLETYETIAKIYIKDERDQERSYHFMQTFKYPNQYRLELLEPEELKGTTILSNGKKSWLIQPSINQTRMLDSFDHSQEQMMFIGYFLRNLYEAEDSGIETETLNGEAYIVITTPLPEVNYYFSYQKLWIDKKKIEPVKLHILDQEGGIRFRVFYENFQYNPIIEDTLFYLKSQEERILENNES